MASGCTVPVDALIVRFRANAKRAAARPQQQRNAVMRGSPSVPCLFPVFSLRQLHSRPGSTQALSLHSAGPYRNFLATCSATVRSLACFGWAHRVCVHSPTAPTGCAPLFPPPPTRTPSLINNPPSQQPHFSFHTHISPSHLPFILTEHLRYTSCRHLNTTFNLRTLATT